MSQMDIEYAIKKDVRNNPIVREIDVQQKREFARTLGVTGLVVGMLLFSAWQHVGVLRHGYEIEQLQKERAAEEVLNRKLRLELEALRAPSRIERLATTDLHMVAPSPKDSLVIERVGSVAPTAHAVVVARAR